MLALSSSSQELASPSVLPRSLPQTSGLSLHLNSVQMLTSQVQSVEIQSADVTAHERAGLRQCSAVSQAVELGFHPTILPCLALMCLHRRLCLLGGAVHGDPSALLWLLGRIWLIPSPCLQALTGLGNLLFPALGPARGWEAVRGASHLHKAFAPPQPRTFVCGAAWCPEVERTGLYLLILLGMLQ